MKQKNTTTIATETEILSQWDRDNGKQTVINCLSRICQYFTKNRKSKKIWKQNQTKEMKLNEDWHGNKEKNRKQNNGYFFFLFLF